VVTEQDYVPNLHAHGSTPRLEKTVADKAALLKSLPKVVAAWVGRLTSETFLIFADDSFGRAVPM
jgi:hypothetical protein